VVVIILDDDEMSSGNVRAMVASLSLGSCWKINYKSAIDNHQPPTTHAYISTVARSIKNMTDGVVPNYNSVITLQSQREAITSANTW